MSRQSRKKIPKASSDTFSENCSKLRTASAIFDLELTSLENKVITASMAKDLWRADPRYILDCFSSFRKYNYKALKFLGISNSISIDAQTLTLSTSLQVGCAPLFSPKTGKPCGNIIVKSRFNDDIAGIASLIESDLQIDYEPEMALNNSPLSTPPLYLECVRFIDHYAKAKLAKWQKFSNFSKVEHQPSSSTDWSKYSITSYDPHRIIQYPNKVNRLILNHPEWEMLQYVLSLSIKEIESPKTPSRVRQELRPKTAQLKHELEGLRFSAIHEIPKHAADPVIIKKTKDIANLILKSQTTQSCAWTFDISKFFERYVQYLFSQAARRLGGMVIRNQAYGISGQRPEWALKYIEPDIIVKLAKKTIIADAKYKRHMTLLNMKSNILKEEFRSDLHQVLAYSSMIPEKNKEIILCYPTYSGITQRTMYLQNPINGLATRINLIGLPMKRDSTEGNIQYLNNLLTSKTSY